MTALEPLALIQRSLGMAQAGARFALSTGMWRAIGPLSALKLARDVARGLRGGVVVIHMHALADPHRPAMVSGERRLSYGELDGRINRLTHGLAAVGVGAGDRVALLLHNSHHYIELNAAIGVRGAVSVQIGYRLKAPEIAYLLSNSGARALVFHAALAGAVEEALSLSQGAELGRKSCFAIEHAPSFGSYEELVAAGDPHRPALADGAGRGAMMVYTSGTTGRSKGAVRDFETMGFEPILHFVSELPLRRDERHLVVAPLYHSAAPFYAALTIVVGGCVVILDHFDPEQVLRTIEYERITSSFMVPTMLARLMALPKETLRAHDLSSLRWLMSGAAPLPTELAREVEDRLGPILYNFYGATETGVVTLAKPGEHTARPGTIGRLVGGNEVRLLGADGRDVAESEVGELYVKNAMLMSGYHLDPAATAAASRDGYVSVGDLAYRDADGYYYLADRKHDMVISGGVNVYPLEIEQRLHQHPAVADAAVVGTPDPEWGEKLVAFVVLRPGSQASGTELAEHVRATLADFKRPRHFVFVEALPRNPTGKVLKHELRARAATESTG